MLTAAEEASQEAKSHLKGGLTAGLIVFDCICRKIILGNKFADEVAAIRRVHGSVPVAGFATYGEQYNAMHVNQTFTGIAIGR